MMQPLAPAGNSESPGGVTNLSTSMSLSLLDQSGNDVPILASVEHPIEFIIPRDVNVVVSPMVLQNVTSLNGHNRSFNLHFVNITQNSNLTVSLHFEMHPLNTSLGYLLIYKFDGAPQLNSSINQTDGWSLFCPSGELFLL